MTLFLLGAGMSYAQNVAKIGSTECSTLQAAIDSARDRHGVQTIEFLTDITENVYVIEYDTGFTSLTIDGANHTMKGQIIIDGHAKLAGTEQLLIKNINFEYSGSNIPSTAKAFIYAPRTQQTIGNWYTGANYNYSHNVTVDNCTFNGDGSTSTSMVAVKADNAGGHKNYTLTNLTASNVHSLAQLMSVEDVTITNCTATNNVRNGINLAQGKGTANVSNNEIKTQTGNDQYAIRIQNQSSATTFNLEGNDFEAPRAFELKGNTNNNCVINVTSGTYVGDVYDIDASTHLNITGGTYSEDVTGEPCAPGYSAFANGTDPETWTVAKAWFLYYDINGGASGTMDTIIVKQEDPVAQRTVVVEDCGFTGQPDKTFERWNTQNDGNGSDIIVGSDLTITQDTTLYAIWKDGYTIYYNNNGGEGVIYQQSKDPGVPVTLDNGANFTKAGQAIYGWNTAANESGDNYGLGGTYNADVTVTMYAVWHDSLSVTNASTDVICHSENNGTDTVKISGGVIPFQLVLSSTALSKNDTVNITDRTYIYENLKPGSYTVKVSDSVYFVTGTFTINEPDTLEITALTVPEKPCPLMGVGSFDASVTAQGGNDEPNYTYAWGDDAEDVNAAATVVPAKADDRDYTYIVSVTVTDIKGCTATATANIAVSLVIADDGTVHANSTLTTTPDTIKVGIYQGCDTVVKDFGTYVFSSTNPAITEDILASVTNNVATLYPDSVFSVGYNPITWTAVDTCGHEITYEQIVYIYHYPCPDAVDGEGNTYPAVRLGCTCWMAQNLKSTKYSSNGNDIDNVMTYVNEDYPNAEANANTYGYLYDWYAAVDTNTNSMADILDKDSRGKRVQGVCPNGWYLPNEADIAELNSYDTKDLRSTTLWVENNGNTNSTGFNAVPSGLYNCSTGRFENLTGESYYWSCHPVYDKVTGAMIDYICEKIMKSNNMEPCNGLSVRCVLIYDPQD